MATYEILDGPPEGGRVEIGGTSFVCGSTPLPSSGQVTSLEVLQPGEAVPSVTVTNFSRPVATLAVSEDLIAVLMNGADMLTGGGGDDRLFAGGEHDLVLGGAGADRRRASGSKARLWPTSTRWT